MSSSNALQILDDTDQLLRGELGALRSLCPGRGEATPLAELGRLLLPNVSSDLAQVFAEGLAAIARAEFENFPGNIFWDFDYTAVCLLREAQARAAGEAAHLARACGLIVQLQQLYGPGTAIRFSYGHDFIYGYDWAKWVAKNPPERAHVGPFDVEFVEYLLVRGKELLELIANNDKKYPQLPDDGPRNPFEFAREPPEEIALFESLAKDGLIPVESWSLSAAPKWSRPFQELRRERAAGLASASHPEGP